jgi:hypothetical protein
VQLLTKLLNHSFTHIALASMMNKMFWTCYWHCFTCNVRLQPNSSLRGEIKVIYMPVLIQPFTFYFLRLCRKFKLPFFVLFLSHCNAFLQLLCSFIYCSLSTVPSEMDSEILPRLNFTLFIYCCTYITVIASDSGNELCLENTQICLSMTWNEKKFQLKQIWIWAQGHETLKSCRCSCCYWWCSEWQRATILLFRQAWKPSFFFKMYDMQIIFYSCFYTTLDITEFN